MKPQPRSRNLAEKPAGSRRHSAATRNPNQPANGNAAAEPAQKARLSAKGIDEIGPDNEQGTTQDRGQRPGQYVTADQQRTPSPNFVSPKKPVSPDGA